MSEADDAFLHVHLDHMQLNSWSQDCVITSGSAILVAKLKHLLNLEIIQT